MTEQRADIVENKKNIDENYIDLTPEREVQLAVFQDQKLGVIFHWGLYSQAGIVESWQLSKEDSWARKHGAWRSDLATLRHDYWALADQFNPQHYHPEEWAKKVQEAGFKYAIFTTKHHDGFAMYHTHQSSYNVFDYTGKDLFGEFARSFRAAGLNVGAYYSKPDWHNGHYWLPGSDPRGRFASYDPLAQPGEWQCYNEFVTQQLLEIARQYGEINILWLDGGWVNSEHNEFLDMDTIVQEMRQTQKNMLVVDRTIGGPYEDYVTPERKVPTVVPRKIWESSIPLAKNWGYVPNDVYKPFSEILTTILQVVSLGGNVILGIGPKPDGTLPSEAEKIMTQLGAWLTNYGEGIYGTRALSGLNYKNSYFTQKGAVIYAFTPVQVGVQIPADVKAFEPYVLNRVHLPATHVDGSYVCEKIELSDDVQLIARKVMEDSHDFGE